MVTPLYNSAPVTLEDEEDGLRKEVEQKLTTDVAKNTLDTIEEVISSFENPVKRKKNSSVLLPRRIWATFGWRFILGILVIAALVGASFLALWETKQYVIIAPPRIELGINLREHLSFVTYCQFIGYKPRSGLNLSISLANRNRNRATVARSVANRSLCLLAHNSFQTHSYENVEQHCAL
jgi:hypothetical protein